MAIPVWAELSGEEKVARTLAAADSLFARDGLDVAMPVLAAAVGAGVGSIYRQVGAKEDVIAALVIVRASRLVERFTAALDSPDAWDALERATYETAEEGATDFLSQSAWDDAAERRADVAAAREAATRALRDLVERARPVLREDASHEDLRLVFKSTREAGALDPGGARRLAQLVLRGMRR
ncbi:TetR/AcrR family transcriptional regulator [Solirubrobacter phytolaccae]|uniref:TetR/AcrR family transcriptional regulator n=1 Tax=Solirubrobacter phytolaccae TaxID=1404360 RepID=A0A9X3N8R2_9ACTN|nr:TetR family transcriptional regulator [Solirubrobacter phytolaccae]MDA0181883.1 TetR/AcrR family transcriptional regulator [Solirubrobacter phytolaccae]